MRMVAVVVGDMCCCWVVVGGARWCWVAGVASYDKGIVFSTRRYYPYLYHRHSHNHDPTIHRSPPAQALQFRIIPDNNSIFVCASL